MNVYPSLTDRLKNQHEAIANMLSLMEVNRTLIRPQPHKWNIHENIAHLARYQLIFIDRINHILSKETPSFGRYSGDEDPEFEGWKILHTDALIKQLGTDRKRIFDLVTNLTEAELNRVGHHAKFGRLHIIEWTEFFLLHEAHHIFTIFQLAHDIQLQ